jgi:geranylgeranyl pyrophosphate synthase
VPIDAPLPLLSADLHAVEAILHSTGDGAATALDGMIRDLLDAGGKRIRPTITLATGRMLEAPPEPLRQLAAALELTHTATLIHDDLVDHAEIRRGQPTLHIRFSTGMAVLAGDYLFAQAARLVAATGCTALVERFATMLAAIVRGEVDQYANRSEVPSMDAYVERIYAKTAAMFETGCACAGLLANRPPHEVAQAGMYGRELGIAFQIMDDTLDFTGDSESIGKPVQRDLVSGTYTLPFLVFQRMRPDDPDLAAALIATRDRAEALESKIASRLVQSIRASGALEECVGQVEAHARAAIRALETFPASPYHSELESLAAQASQRRA